MREQRREAVGGHAGLVVVEQRVVPRFGVADGICFLSRQGEDAVEPGDEDLDVVAFARFRPLLRGERGYAGRFLDQLPRHSTLAIEAAAQLAHVHRLRTLGIADERRCFDGAQQIVVAGIRLAIMHESRKQRHLLRAMLHAPARHADFFVPVQHVETRRQHCLVAREPNQLRVGLIGIHGRFNGRCEMG